MANQNWLQNQPIQCWCLELCAAVLAVEFAEFITSEMHIDLNSVKFYTDSKIVLGYINSPADNATLYTNQNQTKNLSKKSE